MGFFLFETFFLSWSAAGRDNWKITAQWIRKFSDNSHQL